MQFAWSKLLFATGGESKQSLARFARVRIYEGGNMITVSNVSLAFGSRKLFDEVNLKFNKGSCYGVIGANGAGKSTFMKILSGEIEPNKGEVIIPKNERLSVLEQNQEKYNDCTVIRTVL